MKLLGRLYQLFQSVIGKLPSSTPATAITSSEDLRRFLPAFLSKGSEDAFLKEITDFLGDRQKSFYTAALANEEMLFQGDGMQSLLLISLPDTTVRPGRAFLLSNTCDVDPSNKRLFESSITYAPIFKLQTYRTTLIEQGIPATRVDNHIRDLQRQLITQILFLPNVVVARIIDALQEQFGVCGHCGKRKCPGRKSWSRLPDKLLTEDLLDILNAAIAHPVLIVDHPDQEPT